MPINLADLQATIQRLGLRWQAGTTVNSDDSEVRAQSRTGAVPPEGVSLADREERARAALGATAAAATAPPSAWDWRDVDGADYITPVEDQGGCGSCVAFGTIATFEAQVQIKLGNPNLGVDLSEAHLWFCYGPSHGAGTCPVGGWWPDESFPGLIPGIVPAACFPYTDQNQPCNLCSNWSTQLTEISSWETLTTQAPMQEFISQTGPMTACFTVYEDFYYYYTGGVYEYNPETSGSVIGGHCVSVVGYNDDGQYWICKNSWGSGWGENGFFQIGYGNCGIDAEMWGINGTITSEVWPPEMSVQVEHVSGTTGELSMNVTVTARATGTPLQGATVTVYHAGQVSATGTTGPEGTVGITYPGCSETVVLPEPKPHQITIQVPCAGVVTKSGYAECAFNTPMPA
jgi:C1A family cysteine protease